MNSKKYFFLILTLISVPALARKKSKKKRVSGPPHYYYMKPIEASADWTYAIPECQEIDAEDYQSLRSKNNCQVRPDKSETCTSLADVQLKNSKTNEKKSFGLNYVVFSTKKSCEEDREKIVNAPSTPALVPTTTTSSSTTSTVTSTTAPAGH